jgi:hypothetical protein
VANLVASDTFEMPSTAPLHESWTVIRCMQVLQTQVRAYHPTVLLLLVLVLSGCGPPRVGSSVPAGRGLVTGKIQWCSAIGERSGSAPGPVIVVKGSSVPNTSHAFGQWRAHLRPVAQERVRTNQSYRFVLPPGRYILMAYPHTGHYHPVERVTVKQGRTLRADITNGCI